MWKLCLVVKKKKKYYLLKKTENLFLCVSYFFKGKIEITKKPSKKFEFPLYISIDYFGCVLTQQSTKR
jgi:hypothetical protein